ncbi:uncharacterized protein JN550_012129 [Neoarthrinium moseri]|uniref:uncharacterized protein n=1 Tax=Neoarthrinium moseri TaxID=1658444 RepID=UPI001FDDA715|nr:uncharacterized protein JN550_012129 [Neoarthrinium moseri]KAI1859320.1 hypothetical protein JN550_012129 [Neoarthrinium moseri]
MIFTPPSWLPAIEHDLSTVGTVADFALQGTLGSASGPRVDEPTFISASTQKGRTPGQIAQNVEALAAGLAHELQWSPNAPAPGGKVDYLVCWAVHPLRGTCLLLYGTPSPEENAKHLQRSDCRTLIVSPALLQSGHAAAAAASTSKAEIRLYLTERVATDGAQANGNDNTGTGFKTIDELVSFGETLGPLPALNWSPEEAQSSIAYLCATSGTSGVQRLARLSHRGIILSSGW